MSENAIELLHRAIDHPDHPSEAIAKNPGLRSLHNCPDFKSFVEEQIARDFAPAPPARRRPLVHPAHRADPAGDAADHLTDEDAVHIIVRPSTQQQQRR